MKFQKDTFYINQVYITDEKLHEDDYGNVLCQYNIEVLRAPLFLNSSNTLIAHPYVTVKI